MTQPKTLTLTLTLPTAAMEIVLTAIAELPYRMAHPVMVEAQTQFEQQQAAANAAPPAPAA